MAMPDLTLKEAVEFLSQTEENYQQCGATFIQHTTFKEEHTKQEVRALSLKCASSSKHVEEEEEGKFILLLYT